MADEGQSWDRDQEGGPSIFPVALSYLGSRKRGPGGSRRPWQVVVLEQKGLEVARVRACFSSKGWRGPVRLQPGRGDGSVVTLGPAGRSGEGALMLNAGALERLEWVLPGRAWKWDVTTLGGAQRKRGPPRAAAVTASERATGGCPPRRRSPPRGSRWPRAP